MNSLIRRIFFENYVFDVFETVYEPAEDSFLLAEGLEIKKDNLVLDLGSGCGLLAVLAAQRAQRSWPPMSIHMPYNAYCIMLR
jgi:methylase of polypeptide subunit release factors